MSAADFRRSVDVFLSRALSPEAQSAALARVARAGVADLVASGRAPPRYRTFVDGREGRDESTVRPDGVIAYVFDRMPEIAAFALAFLRERSPVGGGEDGHYRDSFWFGLDGRFVPAERFNPKTMGPVSEVIIGNTRPFNRKVDVQTVGRRTLRFSVPAGLYDDAAAAVRGRFGNSVTAKRVYNMRFPGQYRLQQTQFRTGTRSHNVRRWAGTLVESPAIVITAR